MLGRHGLGWVNAGGGAIALGILTAGLAWGGVAAAADARGMRTSQAPAIAQALDEEEKKEEADRLLQQGIQQYRTSQFREALQSWE